MKIDTTHRSHKVADLVLEMIRERGLGAGDQLPGEGELARSLGVSRNTLREAYISLEGQGVIERLHGIGTFVARSPKILDSLWESYGFFDRITRAGYVASSSPWKAHRAEPPQEAIEFLGVLPGEEVYSVARVLLADRSPAVDITDYFAPTLGRLLEAGPAPDQNLLELVMSVMDIRECRLHSRFAPVATDEALASALHLAPGSAVIRITSTLSSPDGEPLSFAVAHLSPGVIEFDIDRTLRRL